MRDHGPGILEEFKPRIFKRIAQAKHDDTRKKGALGSVSTSSPKIVSQHGGIVGFEDAPLGGTLFHFDILLWEAGAAVTSAQPHVEVSTAV